MEWLIQSHPGKDRYQNRWAYFRHWIVPVLTSIVIGITLNTFAGGLIWWAVYILGSLLLFAVFIAEYNVVTAEDYRNPLATVGLTALSFALYLLLAIAVFSADIRLYIRFRDSPERKSIMTCRTMDMLSRLTSSNVRSPCSSFSAFSTKSTKKA